MLRQEIHKEGPWHLFHSKQCQVILEDTLESMPLRRHLKVGSTWIPAFREQYTDKTRMQKKSFLGNFGKVEWCSGWNRVGRQLWWSSCYLSNVCEVGVSVGRKDCGCQIRALLRDNHVFFHTQSNACGLTSSFTWSLGNLLKAWISKASKPDS